MWGRFEGKDGRYSNGITVCGAVVLFLLCFNTILAQELPESVKEFLELNAEAGADVEDLMSFYENMLSNPVSINDLDVDLLARMGIFSAFQIQSLLEYRLEYGDILSASELALVDGFSDRVVQEISPFISFDKKISSTSGKSRIRNNLILRSKFKVGDLDEDYLGVPVYFYSKYRLTYGNQVQLGFTLENDVGEPTIPDFASVHLQFKNFRLSRKHRLWLKSLVIGDFTARLGQGLSLWKSFSISSVSSPSAMYRRGTGLIPYTSSDEQNFFRGVGLTLEMLDKISCSFLYSDNLLDARVDDDVYFSLPSGGYHNKDSSLESRKTLSETVIGGNVSYMGDVFKVGFTSVSYRYDKENGRKVADYNRYQMYNDWWGNASLDIYAVFRRIRLFGELGVDYGGSAALLAGVVYQSDLMESSLLYRYYSRSYIATHAGAHSSLSSSSNQNGFILATKFNNYKYCLEANVDMVYHPWVRYGVKTSSMVLKSYLQYKYNFDSRHSSYIRLSSKWTDYESEGVSKFRVNYIFKRGRGFEFASRVEASYSYKDRREFELLRDMGGLFYLDFRYLHPKKKWFANIRTTLFHVDSWDSRIYAYQRDLPGSFSVPAFYGRGISMYLVGSYRLHKNINLILKVSRTRFISDKSNEFAAKAQLNLTF